MSLPSGSSITYTVFGSVSSTATGTLSNTATLTPAVGVTDSNAATSATDTDNLTPTADLTITKTDSAGGSSNGTVGNAVSGAALSYTITVSNTGPSAAPGTLVSDNFPANFIETGYTTTVTGGATDANGTGSGAISDTVSLPSGSSINYTVTGTVSPTATGTLSNTATVTPGAGVTDSNTTTSATDTDNLRVPADLTVAKHHTGNFFQGETGAVYTITVNNIGSGPTVGTVTVTDMLPSGLSPTAADSNGNLNGWNVSFSGQTVTATRSDALAGGLSYAPLNDHSQRGRQRLLQRDQHRRGLRRR